MRTSAAVVAAMLGWLGCGDDGGVDAIADGGVDAGGREDAGAPPVDSGPAMDAAPADLVECDLRDPEPCAGDAECVELIEFREGFITDSSRIRLRRVCRDGLRTAEGLPCRIDRLPDRDGYMREIDNCTEGTKCVDFDGDFTCRRLCGPDLATCDAGSQCTNHQGFGLDERIGVCGPDEAFSGCDAVLQTGCAAGELCFLYRDVYDLGAGVSLCYPEALLPPQWDYDNSIGRGCDVMECAAGQVCIEEADVWTCHKLCATSGATSAEMSPDGAPWGACPSSAPTCVPMFPRLPTPAGYCD